MNEVVFINYRRNDAAAEATLIAKTFSNVFGDDAVFLDSSSVEAGANWPQRIQDALQSSQYVLWLSGPTGFALQAINGGSFAGAVAKIA